MTGWLRALRGVGLNPGAMNSRGKIAGQLLPGTGDGGNGSCRIQVRALRCLRYLRQAALALETLTKCFPLGRRQLPELFLNFPQALLPGLRHPVELLKTLLQAFPLLGAELFKEITLTTRPVAFIRFHLQPATSAAAQRLLPFRGQGVPLRLHFLQKLLFGLRERIPGYAFLSLQSTDGTQQQ